MPKFNKLRNRLIDATIVVLDKAKAKPPSLSKIQTLLIDADLSTADKLAALNHLQTAIKELKCSN